MLTKFKQSIETIILGQSFLIEQLLIALLTGGHVIIEGVPGTGKTLLVKVIARLIQADFRRIQLTPDILPADILGTNIFDFNSRSFSLKKGPVFTQILLADEINRTPPKTQSALLEAMEEQQVTLDGESLPLGELFWVIATQNPLEFEGTYPLPEAQLDRFLFKLVVDYPPLEAEKQILLNANQNKSVKRIDLDSLTAIADVSQIIQARQRVKQVNLQDSIIDYLLNIVHKTRQHPDLLLGASPRAAVLWLEASKAQAWLCGRDFVTPDDLKAIAQPILRHRLILKAIAQLDGLDTETVINSILDKVPVPR
ncbi:MAG: MoxR family ATPase [Gloeocapsa sp. DLM2.Bin57]|nr:MAG: MoxR family ATPase [Gloeocapsa sp. DLM2.Bin57]